MSPDVVHGDGHGDSERPELAGVERLQFLRGRSRRHGLPGAGAGAGAGGGTVTPPGHVREGLVHAEYVVLWEKDVLKWSLSVMPDCNG